MAAGREVEGGADGPILVNRAPVLTLWAAVVAERLGFDEEEALTLGRALAGLNAYAKGRTLGLFLPTPRDVKARRASLAGGETIPVDLMGRAVPCRRTPEGLRAVSQGRPIDPGSVRRYLEGKFGPSLAAARAAMQDLARAFPPEDLADRAFVLYEAFRPEVARGARGWGAAGVLDLDRLRRLARPAP